MNCPSCGSETFAKQQFCRSCGADLVEDRPRSYRPQIIGLLILLMTFCGLIVAMAGKMFEVRWMTFTGAFIVVAGMFLVAAFALMRELRPRKRKPTKASPQPEELHRADTTNKLLPIGENDYIPSVIEETTDLLETPAARHQ